MRTAVDTSVLLDVLVADPAHGRRSETALRRAAAEGALVIGECVLAEIVPAFEGGVAEVKEFLDDWEIEFLPSTSEAALLAGSMFRAYLARRAKEGIRRVVADFLIGAHAKCMGDRLLARDRGYFRDYFKGLDLLEP